MVTIIGIDCAVQDKNVGLARSQLVEGKAQVSEAKSNFKRGEVLTTLLEWIDPDSPTLLAIDAPLGWPEAMGDTLAGHEAGRFIPIEPNHFFRRRTDIYIKEQLLQQPLDVGADRIARTAHRALQLLSELRVALHQSVDLAWSHKVYSVQAIEVYPAATLASYKIPARLYKDESGKETRLSILERLGGHLALSSEQLRRNCVDDADVLDAVVCVLAGADFLLGRAETPQDQDVKLAQKEGWIWSRPLDEPVPRTQADS